MMSEEHGFAVADPNEVRAALSTFVAFIAVGFLPLAAFVYDIAGFGDVADPFAWSAVLTGLSFFIVGALKTRFVDQAWWRAGIETLLVGGVAATLAYEAGVLLQGVG